MQEMESPILHCIYVKQKSKETLREKQRGYLLSSLLVTKIKENAKKQNVGSSTAQEYHICTAIRLFKASYSNKRGQQSEDNRAVFTVQK
jgi:hypothetical protein